MKDLEIDNYLADMVVAIDDLGGRVNLVGLCQGGWVSAMIAARFPDKVNSLVLAGAPIDTDAGDGPIKRMVQASPLSFYEELVALGGGLMRGKFMLQGWKNMHPEQHYIQDHIDFYEHVDDPGLSRQGRDFRELVRKPDRSAGPLVSSGDRTAVQGEPAGQGRVRRPGPETRPAQHHLSDLSAGRRRRRHHDAGAGARRSRNWIRYCTLSGQEPLLRRSSIRVAVSSPTFLCPVRFATMSATRRQYAGVRPA